MGGNRVAAYVNVIFPFRYGMPFVCMSASIGKTKPNINMLPAPRNGKNAGNYCIYSILTLRQIVNQKGAGFELSVTLLCLLLRRGKF